MHTARLIPGIAIATIGCMTTRHVQPHEEIAPAATVSVAFTTPRDLRNVTDSTTRVVRAVRSVSGRVESVWADTLVLRARAIVSDSVPADLRHPVRLLLVRDASARVSVRRLSRARTVVLVLVLATAALAVALEEWWDDVWQEALDSCRAPDCRWL
jgi:hypothetical protein